MRLPLFDTMRELGPAPRRFLIFQLLNVVSYQSLLGQALVLFARHIEMPPSWVGGLLSFMPLASLLAVFTIQVVTAMGPKRALFMAWLLRNIMICLVFTMPWVISQGSLRSGWYILMAATLGFCMFRALGVGAWFPWLHEMVPAGQRGIFFSAESAITQFAIVCVIATQGIILGGEPGIGHFLLIFAIGIGAGFASLALMMRIPGGAGVPQQFSVRGLIASYHDALADRLYLRFLSVILLCFVAIASFNASFVMYLRDMMHLSERAIMNILAAGALTVFLTIRFWGRYAEYSGSGRTMFKALLAKALVVATFLLYSPTHPWAPYAAAPAVILAMLFGQVFNVSAHRAMLNYVQDKGRLGYTNLWTISTAIAMGGTPNLVGWIIERWGLTGFRICFLMSSTVGLIAAVLAVLVVRDGPPIRPSLIHILNPALPMRTLARIAWITLGMHESNQPSDSDKHPPE